MIFRFLKMTEFYIRHTIRSKAFAFMIFLNIVISILLGLLLFFSTALLKSFVPGNVEPYGLPVLLQERLFNFQWANIMIYIPVLSAAFFGSTALPYEYERGTIYNLSSLPVSGLEIVMSKITGSTLLSFTSTMVLVIFQIVFFALHFGTLPGTTFLIYILFILLVTFSDVCFAVAVSAFFKNSGYSAISFLIVYLVVFDILSLIATGSGVLAPIFIKTNTDRVLYRIFLNADPYLLTYSFSLSPLGGMPLVYISAILIFYSVSTIMIAYVAFNRRRSLK